MSLEIDRKLIESIVRAAVAELGPDVSPELIVAALAKATSRGENLERIEQRPPQEETPEAESVAQGRAEALPPPFAGDLRFRRPQRTFDPADLERIRTATPARLAQGRTGTRYLTSTYIGIRAEHAIALDAVHSEVPDGWAEKLGCLALRTRATDRAEYLRQPDLGRRLHPESRALLEKEGTKGADVQVILSDGLAAWGILENGPELLPSLQRELERAGFSVGRPLFVKYGRIGVQDEIGVVLGARSTLIAVGERPGLGTGNSLSIYTAYGPKLGQDNAEKDCISNIRPLGIPPVEAARECAALLRRTFAAGGGGTHLVRSGQ